MNSVYRAKVLDNNDPSQLGRIKVEVYPMLIGKDTANALKNIVGIDTADLPWASPAASIFDGAGNGFGNFAVPKIGSFVFVFFENGDIYQPVYFAEALDGVHGLPSERVNNYPNRKVLKTSGGVVIEIDDTANDAEIKIKHPSGTYLVIIPDGSIEIVGNKDIELNAIGDINIMAEGNVKITGSRIDLN